MIYSRDNIVNDLRGSVIEVHFTKVDGTPRVIRCTLREDLLPEQYRIKDINEEKEFHSKNPEVIAAWDIDLGNWRSFRVDSVGYIQDVSMNY